MTHKSSLENMVLNLGSVDIWVARNQIKVDTNAKRSKIILGLHLLYKCTVKILLNHLTIKK